MGSPVTIGTGGTTIRFYQHHQFVFVCRIGDPEGNPIVKRRRSWKPRQFGGMAARQLQLHWNVVPVDEMWIQRTLTVFDKIPAELPVESIYFPPFFFTVLLGFVCASFAAKLLNLAGAEQVFLAPRTRVPRTLGAHVVPAWPDCYSTLGAIDACSRHRQKIRT